MFYTLRNKMKKYCVKTSWQHWLPCIYWDQFGFMDLIFFKCQLVYLHLWKPLLCWLLIKENDSDNHLGSQWQSQTFPARRQIWMPGRDCCCCSPFSLEPGFLEDWLVMVHWSLPPHRCGGSRNWAPCWNWGGNRQKTSLGKKVQRVDFNSKIIL